jgi:predicted nucleotidyltransferase component of viral defense system
MTRPPRNLSASVSQRLLNLTRQSGEDYQYVLMRYGLERMMFRFSQSDYATQFVVKGAMLLRVWTSEQYRPTKDLDLLAILDLSPEKLIEIFQEVCTLSVQDDGLEFLGNTIRVSEIREDNTYGGLRVTLQARLGKIRIPLQVDVGFGDAVTPEAQLEEFPTLLDLPAPILLAYPRETSIAEKFEAMVNLGLTNSRMKDYFDIRLLSEQFSFDGETLKAAIIATFKRRQTALPREAPVGLSNEFVSDAGKRAQWHAFVLRSGLDSKELSLEKVVERVAAFVMPPSNAAAERSSFGRTWAKGGPWEAKSLR